MPECLYVALEAYDNNAAFIAPEKIGSVKN